MKRIIYIHRMHLFATDAVPLIRLLGANVRSLFELKYERCE